MNRLSAILLLLSLLLPHGGAQSAPLAAPYGICAHLPRHDADFRERECDAIAALGASTVRFGVSWRGMQKSPDTPLDFSKLDAIVAEAEAHGLTILPILYWPPKWAQPIYEHLGEYAAFIEAVVEHYGERFPAIELWNEENLKGFWGEDPDPTKYALVLKAGYEAAKRANAECKMQNAQCYSAPLMPRSDYVSREAALRPRSGHLSGEAALRPRSGHLSGEAALRPRSGHLSGEAALNGGGTAAPIVYFGGTAGVPLDYIRKAYEAGAAPFFDAMNVHPYSHPYAPEGDLDKKLDNLRALMAEFGDAGKPIVITEHGWPTHDATVKGASILLAGLKVARQERKVWRAVYAATTGGSDSHGGGGLQTVGGDGRSGDRPPSSQTGSGRSGIAAAIEEILPPGSSCEACFGDRLRERLAADNVDVVIYPFDSSFPVDTFDDVCEFVRRGGVLVDTGGAPMWRPCREVEPGRFERQGENNGDNPLRERLRVAVDAWWLNDSLPQEGRAFPTDAALAAGYKGDPAGERVSRFFTPRLLKEGDEMVPLLTLPSPLSGASPETATRPAVAACVLRFNSDFKGAIVLSGDKPRGTAAATDEAGQARYLTRAMAIAFAKGVERYFWYEFRSVEEDPHYSEDHFGLTHADMTPKPAFDAYRAFVARRPPGSVQRRIPLRDGATGAWRSEWTRPDGTVAGVFWKPGEIEDPVFYEGEPPVQPAPSPTADR